MSDRLNVLPSRAFEVRLPDGIVVTVDPISDVLYISFRQGQVLKTVEGREGILVDFGDRGNVLGISVIHPKKVTLERRRVIQRLAKRHFLPVLAGIRPDYLAKAYAPSPASYAHA